MQLIWFIPIIAGVYRCWRVSRSLSHMHIRWVTILSASFVIWAVNPPWAPAQEGLMWFSTITAMVLTLVYRYRRVSTSLERQQIKWAVFGLILLAAADLISLAPALLIPTLDTSFTFYNAVRAPLLMLLGLLIPVSVAFGILRYYLRDIDTLINKALVYGGLSALLGALYAGLIIGLENLAGLFGGQAASNPVVIVISTLAIALLFLPARRRIQSLMDRRFYRKKYDAERVLAAFSTTLRQETDLAQIHERLLAVVQETMQPIHASLWLSLLERQRIAIPHRLEPHGPESARPSDGAGMAQIEGQSLTISPGIQE
jgi:hypothetical protein